MRRICEVKNSLFFQEISSALIFQYLWQATIEGKGDSAHAAVLISNVPYWNKLDAGWPVKAEEVNKAVLKKSACGVLTFFCLRTRSTLREQKTAVSFLDRLFDRLRVVFCNRLETSTVELYSLDSVY